MRAPTSVRLAGCHCAVCPPLMPPASPHTVASDAEAGGLLNVPGQQDGPKLRRSQSRAFLSEDGMPQPIEFFVASDASAVIEHTKRVLYLEDDDIAHISEGGGSSAEAYAGTELTFTEFARRTPHPPPAP